MRRVCHTNPHTKHLLLSHIRTSLVIYLAPEVLLKVCYKNVSTPSDQIQVFGIFILKVVLRTSFALECLIILIFSLLYYRYSRAKRARGLEWFSPVSFATAIENSDRRISIYCTLHSSYTNICASSIRYNKCTVYI